jgi:hypothetical protein
MEEQQSPLPPAQDGDPAGDGAADGGWKVETNGDGAADEDRKAQSNGDGADPESTAQFNSDDDYGYDYGYDDWGFGTWTDRDQEAKLRTRAVEERLDYLGTTRQIGLRCVEQAREEARVQYLFQAGVGILLLIGGAWALAGGIRMLLTANVGAATAPLVGFTITDVAAGKLVTPVLAPPLVLALLGFALIGLALYVVRHRVLQNSLMGVSNIQHELAAGTGETRPLVRVVQETINNARQTFTTVLRLSQALFWVGLLFLAVTLFRAVWQDHLDLCSPWALV